METRANYILIGLFTLLGILGMMAFFLLFARVELDRQFAYYDIRFSSVSGLSEASDVRFSGLPVGQVVDVRLAPEQDGSIVVRVEVNADTPVRTDSVATIEAQGVTGVSFVGISGGTPDAPLLVAATDAQVPEIEAGRSVLQTLSEDAPELITEALQIVQEVSALLTDDNRNLLRNILVNTEAASEEFASALENFSGVADTVNAFADQISRFNATLDTLTGEINDVLSTADTTLASIGALSEETRRMVLDGEEVLSTLDDSLGAAQTYIEGDLAGATEEARALMADLRAQADTLGTEAAALIEGFGATGDVATARLTEFAGTLAAVDRLVASLEATSGEVQVAVRRIDGLVAEEGAPLLSETRALVATAQAAMEAVNAVATVDMPAIVADIRAATDTTTRVVAEVGENLSGASGRVEALIVSAQSTLADVTTTFRNANETLTAVNTAMETGDSALRAAESAFTSADRVMSEDLDGVIAALESTLGSLTGAVDSVAEDLPLISSDLRSASDAAARAFAEVEALAEAAGPRLETFATTGLPLYSRLAQEARVLVENLDRLTNQISRDPARFILNPNTPEFRR
ncbi:MlaD family protein [Dinoroseobacter sp. PD6]|uniref:MCE family protein n=1 Tax=Dinoroseobacter sp. PD6 TaxID=3028384 RepID=UPI00237BFE5F|nr:MlaD family protein [Dinoroseobacter sp. PD6]MDD9719045.1 MlaD family protein [Dinoroseobacter sp. PD6]